MKNIFVGNLDEATSAASIRLLFKPYGAVEHLKLMIDAETGMSRGFAFVEMLDKEADQAIAALNGSFVEGRTIDVHAGRPKLHSCSATNRGGVSRPNGTP